MSIDLVDIFFKHSREDSKGYFRKCLPSDRVIDRLGMVSWQRIVTWIPTEASLFSHMRDMPYSLAALSYVSKLSEDPLCFVLLLKDHPQSDSIISFHGGSWSNPFISFRGGRQMLATLRRCGFEIRTSIRVENVAAHRFVKNLGLKVATRNGSILWYRYPEGKSEQNG